MLLTFQLPVNAKVGSRFGTRVDPLTGKQSFHGGIDLPVPTGTPVGASAAGVVTFAGSQGTAGLLVQIEHAGGVVTQYMHNSKVLVRNGQHVAQGERIALAGSTGRSTGPHVHFSVKVGGQHVDPAQVLANGLNVASSVASNSVAAVGTMQTPQGGGTFAAVAILVVGSILFFKIL